MSRRAITTTCTFITLLKISFVLLFQLFGFSVNNDHKSNSNNNNDNRNVNVANAFTLDPTNKLSRIKKTSVRTTTEDDSLNNNNLDRRNELLNRSGMYWKSDKIQNSVEFGATVPLTTQLSTVGGSESWNEIADWLKDSKQLAMSIWDPKLITPLTSQDTYRLQIMKLQFITLIIQPTVDVLMKTEYHNNDSSKPIFIVQSIDFDPNLQIFPGMNYDAKTLGITIEVAGRLVPSKNGKCVTGCIAFTTTGKLPLALQIIPEQVLQSASEAINEIIVNFAVTNFQKGAKEKYKEYLSKKEQFIRNKQ